MLILTRRLGESIMIGDEVTVTVVEVVGNQVRIGVNAPKDVAVRREDIYRKIKCEQDASAAAVGAFFQNSNTAVATENDYTNSTTH